MSSPAATDVNSLESGPWSRLEVELKYALRRERVVPLLQLLRLTCRADPLHPAATVQTVYFDTPDWRFLREKTDGHYLKSKIRVRWYEAGGKPLGSASFLELKRRVGSRRSKLRLETGLAPELLASMPLDANRMRQLPWLLDGAGVSPPRSLEARLAIAYHRHRFVEPFSGTRISLDTAIRVARTHPRLPAARPVSLGSAVLEVKGGAGGLPVRLAAVTRMGCMKTALSKYQACQRHLISVS